MKHLAITLLLAASLSAATHAAAQTPAQSPPAADPFKTLSFLEQNWEANTNGFNGVQSVANYTFRRLLGGHVLSRVATSGTACKGPADFDCGHNDMLYIFQDAPGQPLKAIYFDNEGHVIHYDVTTPAPESVVFLSDSSSPGPRFRLTYGGQERLAPRQIPDATTRSKRMEILPRVERPKALDRKHSTKGAMPRY